MKELDSNPRDLSSSGHIPNDTPSQKEIDSYHKEIKKIEKKIIKLDESEKNAMKSARQCASDKVKLLDRLELLKEAVNPLYKLQERI